MVINQRRFQGSSFFSHDFAAAPSSKPMIVCVESDDVEDDSSMHSTFAVDDFLAKTSQQDDDDVMLMDIDEPSRTRRPRKSVKFDLSCNEEFENMHFFKEDCSVSWYHGEDYRRFKSDTRHEARRVHKSDQQRERRSYAPLGYDRVMSNAYEACRSAFATAASVDSNQTTQQQLTSLQILGVEQADQLRKWVSGAAGPVSRIGLEKWLLPDLRAEWSSRKHCVIDLVLMLQQTMTETGQHDYNRLSECLRDSSESISGPSRWFAHCAASALAADVAACAPSSFASPMA